MSPGVDETWRARKSFDLDGLGRWHAREQNMCTNVHMYTYVPDSRLNCVVVCWLQMEVAARNVSVGMRVEVGGCLATYYNTLKHEE